MLRMPCVSKCSILLRTMKKIIILFLFVTAVYGQDKYRSITERNAFSLVDEKLPQVEAALPLLQPPVKLHLTGIMKYQGLTNVFLYSKDLPKRFLTLNHKKPADSGVELLSVKGSQVKIINNGVTENLSFETHRLPTVMGPAPVFNRPTVVKKDSKDDKNRNKDKKAAPAPRPSVVKVPSRSRGTTDPRMQQMMERGLEYLNRIDDPEKKEAMLERLEKFQRGDYDKEIKDRMKRYEEYRKNRKEK